jgi:gluconokinase
VLDDFAEQGGRTGRNGDRERPATPAMIVVTGVAGSGKTTIGRLLADRLGCEFADADDFHPAANVRKMRSGEPLTDADRRPWMRTIVAWLTGRLRSGRRGVLSCSALKRADRDRLGRAHPAVRIVHLHGDRDLIARRMRRRIGHFFDVGLLDSQFRDLEPPDPAEDVVTVPITGSPDEITDRVLAALGYPTGKR